MEIHTSAEGIEKGSKKDSIFAVEWKVIQASVMFGTELATQLAAKSQDTLQPTFARRCRICGVAWKRFVASARRGRLLVRGYPTICV